MRCRSWTEYQTAFNVSISQITKRYFTRIDELRSDTDNLKHVSECRYFWFSLILTSFKIKDWVKIQTKRERRKNEQTNEPTFSYTQRAVLSTNHIARIQLGPMPSLSALPRACLQRLSAIGLLGFHDSISPDVVRQLLTYLFKYIML
jgi:hypothetical protein